MIEKNIAAPARDFDASDAAHLLFNAASFDYDTHSKASDTDNCRYSETEAGRVPLCGLKNIFVISCTVYGRGLNGGSCDSESAHIHYQGLAALNTQHNASQHNTTRADVRNHYQGLVASHTVALRTRSGKRIHEHHGES